MANRAFKQFTIQAGGTPQPLVGTWVTATTPPGPIDQGGNSLTNLPVNDSSMCRAGDWAYLVTVGLTLPEKVQIQSVPDGTHIKVKNLQNQRTGGAFGAGDFVSLAIAVNSVYCQCKKGNAASLFIGMQGIVKATYANVVAEMLQFVAATQPIDFSDTRTYGPNPGSSSDWWIDGTTADGYLPSFGVA